ncbi:MAG: hypothetical protein CXX69_04835 [Candidatus Thalassarchaeum betae]|uniref:Uncharacterized protein n=1 Tax=Candidatus Thalassarchaeum betae TaxID=2599289 RepID=A0A2V3HUA0_9ARCH|nr:MAG: hypothetical protein CXX69_04835 [Candidatus Thalassoarchaea betae]PXF26708.1 MAG: hypothetical protein CXX70_02495 [Euryarchaeota archaeon]HIM13709.1 hypothetical protein [Candidatus Poseidoniales archaeon]HIM93362.1 hypothetical protein [Candidatus Poseidoniales archaeon]
MDTQRVALAVGLAACVLVAGAASFMLIRDSSELESEGTTMLDPLLQDEEHDHRNASYHILYTENVQPVSYNELTDTGNAEIQVADSPDGKTYAYIAGWTEMHIVDVTDPSNTTVTGVYYDPNTQVFDVKYLEYNGREYVILQNQIIDPGAADPNVGNWEDPVQVSVTLVDVTDKSNPSFVDFWYDADHPSGPHNLYTHMIDNEWYIFVANPDYESCDVGQGDACGGITIAHLNFAGFGDLPRIVKIGEAEVSWETTRGGWIYIHDMTVQTWPSDIADDPRNGRTYIYGAYWEAGLRIFDVSDVPHPNKDMVEYLWYGSLCRLSGGTQAGCTWRAPEVGMWMDFEDFDGDGEPDSGTTGNENGGRASYIHYAEPFDKMVDASHLGYPQGKRHLTLLATEVLETTVGTGMVYLLDTTSYEEVNGNLRFLPSLIHGWENPFAWDHHIPGGEEWLLFSPHNADTQIFQTGLPGLPDNSHGGAWDGRIYLSSYHAGLWVIDVETLMAAGLEEGNKTDVHMAATVGYHVPHSQDGVAPDSSFYDFGWTPFLWAAEHHEGYTYLSCITSGMYIVQLDIDKPYGSLLEP